MSLHSPERQQDESQEDYRARRALSRELLRASRAMAPSERPKAKSARAVHRAKVWVANHAHRLATRTLPKPLIVRARKPKKAIKPTWPESDDQKAQSRPVIVLGKNRERDATKRTKPKSAVAKRMDRPHRNEAMERGHAKLMRFLSGAA